jgi:hypothetical protein
MARRKIHGIRVGKCAVNIYRDSEWDEYLVQSVVKGKVVGGKEGGGYFTDDKEDAFGAAEAEVATLRKRPVCEAPALGRRRRRRRSK